MKLNVLKGDMRHLPFKSAIDRLTPKPHVKKCVKCGKEIPLATEACDHCGTKQSGYVRL